jgi:hypothetical protein
MAKRGRKITVKSEHIKKGRKKGHKKHSGKKHKMVK